MIGGHDIRQTSFAESAEEFRRNSGVFEAGWITACQDELAAATARVRPGTHFGAGRAIASLGHWGDAKPPRTARQAADRIAADMAAFVDAEAVDHMIVLNVASTEPPFALGDAHQRWDALNAELADGGPELLPASSLYALAALRCGYTYINFTPSLGASLPALDELAQSTGLDLRRQGRQDRRDLDENGPRPHVRQPQSQGHELGRPQHLRQPRRPGPRRSRPTSRPRSKPRTAS